MIDFGNLRIHIIQPHFIRLGPILFLHLVHSLGLGDRRFGRCTADLVPLDGSLGLVVLLLFLRGNEGESRDFLAAVNASFE